MKLNHSILIVLLNCFLFLSPIMGVNYYFSTASGNDARTIAQANNSATPWKTIAKLNSMMWALRPGDSILFKRGEVFTGATIEITPSGTVAKPIVFAAYGTGSTNPKLDSRLAVTNWVSLGGGIWEAPFNSPFGLPSGLTINDKFQPIGRYPNITAPNGGYLTISSHPALSKTQFSDRTLKTTPTDWTDAEVVTRTIGWVLDRSVVASHIDSTITLVTPAAYEFYNGYGYFFQNHPATLDTNGEWCYMENTSKIRMYSTVNPSTLTIKATDLDYYVKLTSNSNITISNIDFVGSKKAAINTASVVNFKVQNCNFFLNGNSCIDINGTQLDSVRNVSIINNSFSNTLNTTVDLTYGNTVVVSNNKIKKSGVIGGMGGNGNGTYMGLNIRSTNLTISQNTVDSIGYLPICVGYKNNVLVQNNVVSNFNMVKDDGGGLYTYRGYKVDSLATNIRFVNNIIYNGIGAVLGRGRDIATRTHGIYLDDRAANVEVNGNSIFNCPTSGIFMHNSPRSIIKNNTVLGGLNSFGGYNKMASIGFPLENCVIQNNTFVNNSVDSKCNSMSIGFDATFYNSSTVNNNIYCDPFLKDDYLRYGLNIDAPENTSNLAGWQANKNFDLNSTAACRTFAKCKSINSANAITNGTFTSNFTNWSIENKSATAFLSLISGELDGNALKVEVVGTTGKQATISTPASALVAGKAYLVKFSVKASAKSSMQFVLQNGISPYDKVTPIVGFRDAAKGVTFGVSSTRAEKEFIIRPTATTTSSRLAFLMAPENGMVYLDNVQFYEVTPVDSSKYVWMEYNAGTIKKSVVLNKRCVTPSGKTYAAGSTLVLDPFTSVVLMVDSLFNKLYVDFESTDINLWTANPATSITHSIVANPTKVTDNLSQNVLKVTKTGGATALAYHNVGSTYYLAHLTKDSSVLELKVLFRSSENTVANSSMAVRFNDATSEIQQKVNTSDSWQTLRYDFSTLPKFANLFNQNKDTTTSNFSFLPRCNSDQLSTVTLYVDDVRIIPKSPITQDEQTTLSSQSKLEMYYDCFSSRLIFKSLPEDSALVLIANLLGKEIQRVPVDQSNMKIDVSNLNRGVYIVSCYTSQGIIYSSKFIK